MTREEERKRIGERIAALRKQKGFTQAELGTRCDLQQSHLARIEAGRYSIGFDNLQAIAEALGGTVDIVI